MPSSCIRKEYLKIWLCAYQTTLCESFSHKCKLMVFHWSLNDSKSPQVSRTLNSILADLNNAVVQMISVLHPMISARLKPLGTVQSTPIWIGITVTFMLQSLFRSKYLSHFSFSLIFTLWSAGTAKFTIRQIFFSFFC